MQRIIALALCLFLTGLASADELFVSNKPFTGPMTKVSGETAIGLQELAKLLGVESAQSNGAWTIDGQAVQTTTDSGEVLITLSELKKAGFRVIKNPGLGTVDIYSREKAASASASSSPPPNKTDNGNWGSQATLVYFGAKW